MDVVKSKIYWRLGRVANLNDPHIKYLKTRIETASQPQLLVMLFDGAVKKLGLAKQAIEKKDIDTSHQELTKVQKIFTELMVALDMDKGGELAVELFRIYDFVYHHLVKANIKQDIEFIDEVFPIVENLRDAWRQAVEMYENGESGTVEMPKPSDLPSISKTTSATIPQAAKPKVVSSRYPTAPSPPAASSTPEQRPRLNIRG